MQTEVKVWSENLRIILVEPADSDCIYENAKAHLRGKTDSAKVRSTSELFN